MNPQSGPHILILTHRQDTFDDKDYMLREMAGAWRGQGFRVSVQYGPGDRIETDIAILHIDLTFLPAEYLAHLRQYPKALNGRVIDISKRAISRNRVERGDGYGGPVIVKTNRNCAGSSEAWMVRRKGGPRKWASRLRKVLPWTCQSQLSSYPIYPSAAGVPWAVWLNRDLVVERFLPERQDDFYCLRTWIFFGDQEMNAIGYSHEPVIKSRNIVRRAEAGNVPDDLRQMRKDLGFDFGKFDYAIVNGRAVLYDANATPTMGVVTDAFLANMARVAGGIHFYLRPPTDNGIVGAVHLDPDATAR